MKVIVQNWNEWHPVLEIIGITGNPDEDYTDNGTLIYEVPDQLISRYNAAYIEFVAVQEEIGKIIGAEYYKDDFTPPWANTTELARIPK